MREIPLTKGKVALVDDADYAALAAHKWCAQRIERTWYATRRTARPNSEMLYMHRVVMAAPVGVLVDHRDGDGLNNVRGNLRLATKAQNNQNRPAARGNRSGFKGVSFVPKLGKWRAYISVQNRTRYLGTFATPEAAHAAYRDAAVRHFGEFARFA